ncbi:MAG: acetyl-CoA carboxylase biotin carboxyl carrier protein subunit [Tannerellaceae bacterium]|jgi:biotin carboxyl carrier protein|nr:acetyl-CoA carboxylase biotin carboxyl carrier protein subunit [Tannerellaceae bacterium]
MDTENNSYVDFVVTARKYKTLLTKKYIGRPVWNKTNPGEIRATLPGSIVELKVKLGEEVKEGSLLLVLEAMKMLNRITSPVCGTVKDILVSEGDKVGKNHLMIVIATE